MCACAWMNPPITPNGPSSAPSRNSIPGMIVWYGRRPGSTAPETAKQAPRFWSDDARPGRDDARAERSNRLWMKETAIRSSSTAQR